MGKRTFGSIRKTVRNGKVYIEASFPTPTDAFTKWDGFLVPVQ